MKLSFLTKPTFPKFCDSFSESRFQPKITTFYYWFYWFWISSTTGLLVLNKFIEINTLIKRNLNFKCEVKSHKVRLQAYCNKPLLKWSYLYLSITWLHCYDVISTRCIPLQEVCLQPTFGGSECMSICQNQGTTCQWRHYHMGRVTPDILSGVYAVLVW